MAYTKEQKQQYQKEYRQKNKQKLYADDKRRTQERRVKNKLKAIEYLGGVCFHCGLKSAYRGVYDFHHKNPEDKEKDPGSLMHYSWNRIKEELDKCILLCANCHRIQHEKENNNNE